MFRQFLFSLLLGLVLLGCASKPEEIHTSYVSPIKYKNFTCEQMKKEIQMVSNQSATLYNIIKDKAEGDNAQMAIGLLLFWPALFLLEGGNGPEATEYSTLKGEYKAIKESMIYKKCDIDNLPLSPEQIMKSPKQSNKSK